MVLHQSSAVMETLEQREQGIAVDFIRQQIKGIAFINVTAESG